MEYINYDKKGKETSKVGHTTNEITEQDGIYTATVKVESQDLKNKNNAFSNEYTISCQDGMISIDMMRFFDSSQMSQFGENMDVKVDGNAISFPANVNVGDQLDDGYISISMSSGGVKIMTLTMNITNRRVAAEESITTSAGTFDCKKIIYDFDSKAGIAKIKGTAEQWFTKDQVLVKSITKNKKGKNSGETLLTKLAL